MVAKPIATFGAPRAVAKPLFKPKNVDYPIVLVSNPYMAPGIFDIRQLLPLGFNNGFTHGFTPTRLKKTNPLVCSTGWPQGVGVRIPGVEPGYWTYRRPFG
jgi:hypothetical protein